MKQKHLRMYTMDLKYVRNLSKADDRVFSISPQIGKERRPFVGLVVICESKQYLIPLSSPKPKHQSMRNAADFSRILNKNGKVIGVLNFNNMVPVDESVVHAVSMKPKPRDSAETIRYKALLNDQLDWCNANRDAIVRKAEKLYLLVTETPERSRRLVSRCCDFRKLEQILSAWQKSHGQAVNP